MAKRKNRKGKKRPAPASTRDPAAKPAAPTIGQPEPVDMKEAVASTTETSPRSVVAMDQETNSSTAAEQEKKFEPTQNLFEGIQHVWQAGNGIPVLNMILHGTWTVSGALVGVTTGRDLEDVLNHGVKPKLAELDHHLDGLLHGYPSPPKLSEEVIDMIAASTLIYMVPKEKLHANNRAMLNEPINPADLCRDETTFKGMNTLFTGDHQCRLARNGAKLVVVSNNKTSKAVYGILLDKVGKRIIVTFRGADNIQDFVNGLDDETVRVANPVLSSSSDVIFYKDFLYCLLSKDFSTGVTKYAEIAEHVVSLLDQYKGFTLYVTGYNLGAALATIFAFYASTNALIDAPIVCMPVASPCVGDSTFFEAFQFQETKGRIKMLRIENDHDLVPQDGGKHVGVGLTLSKGIQLGPLPVGVSIPFLTKEVGHLELAYGKDVESSVAPGDNVVDMLSNQDLREYLLRAELNEGRLHKMTLDGLYDDKNLVGDGFKNEESSKEQS